MAERFDQYTGKEPGFPKPYADKPLMISRTGQFSNFTGSNSYNVARASSDSSHDTADTTYDGNHILVHSFKIVNTNNTDRRFIYFYEDDDSTNANARNNTNQVCWFGATGNDEHAPSNVLTVHFPIPLVIKNGLRVSSNGSGIILNINYTVLNTTKAADYTDILQYKFLSADSFQSNTATDFHGQLGTYSGDIEIWGGVIFNKDEDDNDYKSSWVTSTGESDVRKAYLTAPENQPDDVYRIGQYGAHWFPYPVLCKKGAKAANTDNNTYATWFYRPRQSTTTTDYGWV